MDKEQFPVLVRDSARLPRPVFVGLLNGIMTVPGGQSRKWNWNRTIAEELHSLFGVGTHRFAPIEYFAGPLSRALFNEQRGQLVIDCVNRWPNHRKLFVTHSNGADVFLDAQRIQRFRVDIVLMIAPAIPCDFEENGLNELLRDGTIGQLIIWRGGKDWALKLARHASWLGYGSLGLDGGKNLADGVEYLDRFEPDWGHLGAFTRKQILYTTAYITLMIDCAYLGQKVAYNGG